MMEKVAPVARLTLHHELIRKGVHLATASIPVAYFLGTPRGTIEALLAVASVIALLVEGSRRASTRIGAAFERAFGVLLRQRERTAITGATWLVLACLGAVLVFSRSAAIAALWCATVGDPAATIAGRVWTAARVPPADTRTGKTIIGSLACIALSFAGAWMLAGYALPQALTIAVAAAAAEGLPGRLNDNVRVTGAAGAIAQMLA